MFLIKMCHNYTLSLKKFVFVHICFPADDDGLNRETDVSILPISMCN